MSKVYDYVEVPLDVMKQVIEALRNVPEVGGTYDQQHSDTQIKAILALQELLDDPDSNQH